MKNPLRDKIYNWKNIGCSDVILNHLKEGVKFQISNDLGPCEFKNNQFSVKEETFISQEIDKLLTLGYITECSEKPYCISPITFIPKKKGEYRLITDLRYVNAKCIAPKFSNEDINVLI